MVELANKKCKKCSGEMKEGVAIQNTLTGLPDFHGDKHAVTLSPGGPGRLIDCMKCSACGWSVTTDADHAHIKDLISIFGAKSRVDGTSSETRQAYADCMLALDAMFAVRGVA